MADARAIRINGTDLQWFDGTTTRTRTGNQIASSSPGDDRSIYIPASENLTYIDNNGVVREIIANDVAAAPAGVPDRAIRLPSGGSAIEYVYGGRIYQVTELPPPPTEYPRSLSLSYPILTIDPSDARLDWTNDTGGGTAWSTIHVQFYRFAGSGNPISPNGVVESFTYTNTSTDSSLTTTGYWYSGDEIYAEAWYEDSNGQEGPHSTVGPEIV